MTLLGLKKGYNIMGRGEGGNYFKTMGRRKRPNLSLGEKLIGNHWSKDIRAPFILEVRFPGFHGQQYGVLSPGDWCLSQQWKDGGL